MNQTIEQALLLLGNCATAYRNAPPNLRRRLNQALFTALLVDEDGEVRADTAEYLETLVDASAATENDRSPGPWEEPGFWDDDPQRVSVGGLKADRLVGAK